MIGRTMMLDSSSARRRRRTTFATSVVMVLAITAGAVAVGKPVQAAPSTRATTVGAVGAVAPTMAGTPTSALALNVLSARDEPRAFGGAARTPDLPLCTTSPMPDNGACKGDPIANFKYIVNFDATGTTDQRLATAFSTGCGATNPGYPNTCRWPSIAEPSGWAPIYTQGDQGDFPLANIPDGRYLISVIAD